MDWRDIPSLAALRAFEAAGRSGSFSEAARELNVTHAAIAQHVRGIEAQLQTSLLVRSGRGVALTDAGHRLAAALSEGFSTIAAGVRDVAAQSASRAVTVTVTPSFAENWLMPRLPGFWAAHPEVQLSISPTQRVMDLRVEGFDLAIRYGRGDWDGVACELLVTGDFNLVGASALVGNLENAGASALEKLPWLLVPSHSEARRWIRELGVDLDRCHIKEMATSGMAQSAARAGAGVTVISNALVADDLAEGKLFAVQKQRHSGTGYFVVHRNGWLNPRTKVFRDWLMTQSDCQRVM